MSYLNSKIDKFKAKLYGIQSINRKIKKKLDPMWQSKDFSWTEIITSRRKLHVSVKLMFLKILSTQYVLNFECPQKFDL